MTCLIRHLQACIIISNLQSTKSTETGKATAPLIQFHNVIVCVLIFVCVFIICACTTSHSHHTFFALHIKDDQWSINIFVPYPPLWSSYPTPLHYSCHHFASNTFNKKPLRALQTNPVHSLIIIHTV